MSSRRWTSVTRPAQYRSTRSVGSRGSSAWHSVSTSPVPTASPEERSAPPKPISRRTTGSAIGGYLAERAAHQVEVVPVLDHRAERGAGDRRRQRRLAEE